MHKRTIAAALSVLGVALINSGGAQAAPIEVSVRIEGIEKTLFEGPVTTEGHDIKAASEAESHPCDGTNAETNPEPGATPTAASVDAMEIIGDDFDGEWFSGFEDYGIERWGPDSQDFEFGEFGAFWGVGTNWEFALAGGCQLRAAPDDQVLWVWDAFSGRGLLRLEAAGDSSEAPEAPTPVASVEVGQPLEVHVESTSGGAGEGGTTTPSEGVTVAPVDTEPGSGYQTVETGDPLAETTDAGGDAEITFPTPGWYRLKAEEETGYIRSNRLDVCVEPVGGGGCGAPPADSQLRVPPRYAPDEEDGGDTTGGGTPGGGSGGPSGGNTTPIAPPDSRVTPKRRGSFALRKARLRRGRGTAMLQVHVPSAGRLAVFGRGLVKVRRKTGRPATVRVPIRLRGRALALLRKRGRLRVRVKVRFKPRGGKARTRSRGLVLRMGATGG